MQMKEEILGNHHRRAPGDALAGEEESRLRELSRTPTAESPLSASAMAPRPSVRLCRSNCSRSRRCRNSRSRVFCSRSCTNSSVSCLICSKQWKYSMHADIRHTLMGNSIWSKSNGKSLWSHSIQAIKVLWNRHGNYCSEYHCIYMYYDMTIISNVCHPIIILCLNTYRI